MAVPQIAEASENAREIAAFLEDRLYEFNVRATGCDDGADLCFTIADDRGELVAGIAGDTWGRCCAIKQLWVAESHRGRGYGRALIQAAEDEARHRRCLRVIVSSHSFQAPGFYERLGYRQIARVEDEPTGHARLILAKQLLDDR